MKHYSGELPTTANACSRPLNLDRATANARSMVISAQQIDRLSVVMSKKHTACNETSCLEVGKTIINIIIIIIIMLIFIITIITGFQLYSFFWEAKHNSALGHFEGSKTMNNNHPQHHHGLTVFLRAPRWMLLQSMLFGPCHCRVAVGAEDCVLDRIMAVFKNKQSKQVLVRVLV